VGVDVGVSGVFDVGRERVKGGQRVFALHDQA
jgi:hypothetical protein